MLLSWNVTKSCNLKCLHCYRDAGRKSKSELSFIEGVKLLKEIALSGFRFIIFSGGEPLLRKDIFRLIEEAKELNLKALLGSNGTLLRREVVRNLKKAGLDRVGISIDSIDEKRHDKFRNFKGAFKKSLKGIFNCREADLDFQIHTTVTDFNYSEIDEIIDFSKNIGAKAFHLFFLVFVGRAKRRLSFKREEIKIWRKRYEDLLLKVLKKREELKFEIKPTCAPQFIRIAKENNLNIPYQKGCLAGIEYCCLLPNGDLHPCAYLPIMAGNIREKSFIKLWKENNLFQNLRRGEYKGICGRCFYKDSCRGCRAHAYYLFGDYLREDSFCNRN